MSCACKNCGGDLIPESQIKGMAKCSYCGSIQTIPVNVSNKYERAERLRRERKNFDEAGRLYQEIINEAPEEPDSYWGYVLCKYGIEYVIENGKEYLPTCHRTIEIPILEDVDFKLACEKASEEQKKYYLAQADYIDAVQKQIIDISRKEKPYDVFISYKAKDDEGKSTEDSKYCQKIFNMLENRGYRVFFAEETLKAKLGKEYEPIIYSALTTSKCMILFGSRPEYYEATWVKNEWMRYLSMMNTNKEKQLIVTYCDMDPYLLPQELASIQALDWKDAEAMNTLQAAIESIFGEKSIERGQNDLEKALAQREKKISETKIVHAEELIKNSHYSEAVKILDELIKANPNYYEAYWMRFLAKNKYTNSNIIYQKIDMSGDPDYLQAILTDDSNKAAEYKRICKICIDNQNLQSEYDKKIETVRQDLKNFEGKIVNIDDRSRYVDKLEQLKYKIINAKKEDSISTSLIFIVLLALKYPVVYGLTMLFNKLDKSGSGIFVGILMLITSLILFLYPIISTPVISFFYSIIQGEEGEAEEGKKKGIKHIISKVKSKVIGLLIILIGILAGVFTAYVLFSKESISSFGGIYVKYDKKDINLLLFYAVEIVLMFIAIINIISIFLSKSKGKNRKKRHSELLNKYETYLDKVFESCNRIEKEIYEEISKKKSNEAVDITRGLQPYEMKTIKENELKKYRYYERGK